MSTPSITAAARIIAKVLAHRATPQDEIAGLIHNVHGALARLGNEQTSTVVAPEPFRLSAAPRPKRQPRVAAPRLEEPAPAPPPAPKLVRRAEVPAPNPHTAATSWSSHGTLRGVVKWFDPRTGKGALRLPGFSGDVALEARLLAESGIARLFKGQEVEATLAQGGSTPQLQHLAVPGTVAPSPVGSGMVRSRQAKPVLVELKREGLRRVAARAEAEHVLGSGRSR